MILFATLGNGLERGFYLDVSQNVPEAPAMQAHRPAGAGHLWRGAAEHTTQRSGRARSR
jgi:hypothetical protein